MPIANFAEDFLVFYQFVRTPRERSTQMDKQVRLVFGLTIVLAVAPGASSMVVGKYPLSGRVLVSASRVPQGRNAIYGRVFGESHRPVPDVYVELLDDVNSTLRQVKTDAAGRFTFDGLLNGRYIVRVRPYGTDYTEQSQEVTLAAVSTVRGSGSDTQHIDINLRVNERAAYTGPFAPGPSFVFAQDVPQAAKKLYEDGVRYLRDKKEQEGLESLKKSLEVFPDYYLALDRLGAEYAVRGIAKPAYLQAGLILLTRAVEINPDGFPSVFGLGWTQYQLGLNAEAIETLRRATTLYGKSADAHLWLGKALKRGSALDQAEAALKRAKELTNGKVGEVHRQLAGLYIDQKRYREAADELELVLKVEPNVVDAEKIRGLVKQLREKAG
jgi:Tfp pilus assembly protein PilF